MPGIKPCELCKKPMEYRNATRKYHDECKTQIKYKRRPYSESGTIKYKRRRNPDDQPIKEKTGFEKIMDKFMSRRTEAGWAEVQAMAGEAL